MYTDMKKEVNTLTLLELRSRLDLSQLETAKMIGISVGAYWKAENGKPISRKIADQICTALQNPSPIEGLNIAPRPIKRPKLVV